MIRLARWALEAAVLVGFLAFVLILATMFARAGYMS